MIVTLLELYLMVKALCRGDHCLAPYEHSAQCHSDTCPACENINGLNRYCHVPIGVKYAYLLALGQKYQIIRCSTIAIVWATWYSFPFSNKYATMTFDELPYWLLRNQTTYNQRSPEPDSIQQSSRTLPNGMQTRSRRRKKVVQEGR